MILSPAEQARELVRCAQSASYLGNTYGYIRAVRGGKIKFTTWDFQDECLQSFRQNRAVIVNKSRQIGLSTVVALYILWRLLFWEDQHIIIMAIKEKTASETFRKVLYMFDNLPPWLKRHEVATRAKRNFSLVTSGGGVNRLEILPKGADATRSAALNLLVIDEAAHIDNMAEIWLASEPSLSTGGDVIALSTPNGAGDNWFYQEMIAGQEFWAVPDAAKSAAEMLSLPPFYPLEYGWQVHPDRNEQWKDENLKKLKGDTRLFAQEYDCSFLGSADTFVEPELLTELAKLCTPPILNDDGLSVWSESSEIKLLAADCSLGTAKDYSTIQILGHNGERIRQIAEQEIKTAPELFADRIFGVALKHDVKMIVVERNSIGQGVLSPLRRMLQDDKKLHLLWFEVKDDKRGWIPWFYTSLDPNSSKFDELYAENKVKLGYSTDHSTRRRNLLEMSAKLRSGELCTYSRRLHHQFLNYRLNHFRRPDHDTSNNDDLIMALAIGTECLSEWFPFTSGDAKSSVADLIGLFSSTTSHLGSPRVSSIDWQREMM